MRHRRLARPNASHLLAAIAALALLAIPPTLGTRPSGATPYAAGGGPLPAMVTATVTFGGTPIDGATGPSSAIASSFASVVPIQFNWSAHGGRLGATALVEVTVARVEMIYLGQPILSREVDISNPQLAPGGLINMSGDFREASGLLEGLYSFEALLLVANGSTAWNAFFYVDAASPDHFTVVNLLLLGLIGYELYGLVTRALRASRPPERSGD